MAKPEEFSAELAAAIAAEGRAKKAAAKAQHKVNACRGTVLAALKNVTLVCCRCGIGTPLKQFEMITEYYGGHQNFTDYDGWTYSTHKMVICPECGACLSLPEIDGVIERDICNSFKDRHSWHSDRTRPSGRVAELLHPSEERRAQERAAKEKAQKLEAARKLLKEEGEL